MKLGISQEVATVYYSSPSAISLAIDQVHYDRTKHIDVRYHFLHIDKKVKVKKIETINNPIDFFT